METKMHDNISPEVEEMVEVEAPVELDEHIGTIRPPDPITVPTVQTRATPAANPPLERLPQLGNKIAQIAPVEPPPKPRPQPKVHQRPSEGFD